MARCPLMMINKINTGIRIYSPEFKNSHQNNKKKK